jgi:predicted metalloprotease with PDZ domain
MSSAVIRYEIQPSHPAAHIFSVTMTIDAPLRDKQVVRLPTWIPGSYMIREFAKNVVQLTARDSRGPILARKVDKTTWAIEGAVGALRIRYDVYAWDLSVRTAHLDQTHGFFNGTSVFLEALGHENGLHEVTVLPPDDSQCADWKVATAMERVAGDSWGFGTFRAADYDELIDHPFELGTFEQVRFWACGVPHDIVLTGRHRCDTERLMKDLTVICEHQIRFFGEPAPVARYVFLVMVVGDGYGGLEHRASTALICKRADLPQPGVSEVTSGYRQFLGLCSHEYFHTWNVKRIKPSVYVPYDLTTESHTTLLWAFEGITSYYDDLLLLRSGLITTVDWLELLGRTITRVRSGSGRSKQSLSDSSFDAWTKFYLRNENTPNAVVSYYAKGALVALALDLEIRRVSQNTRSLDDVMKRLWQRAGDGRGVGEAEVEQVACEVAGCDLTSFFDDAIRGTEDLALEPLLEQMGVTLSFRASRGGKDLGGTKAKPSKGLTHPGDIGVSAVTHKLGAKLKTVHDGGAAQQAGLSAGDVVVAVDGLRVQGDFIQWLRSRPAGDEVTMHVFRRDELMLFQVTLAECPQNVAWLEVCEAASEAAHARRSGWWGVSE